MATIAAVNQVGETLVALLRARRDLMAAAGQLGPLPAAFDIAHLSTAKLASTPPTTGLSLTCYRVAMSEHPANRPPVRDPARTASIAVELQYLIAAWSSAVADEQAIMTWAMLELAGHPVLDRSLLTGANVWGRDETVQIVPDTQSSEAVFRIWDAIQSKYRLSDTFRARVIRISHGPGEQWPPVLATRFGLADTDALEREPG